MTHVDVILNSKGGTGKTTFAANTAAYLAARGRRVIMIDGDKQPTLPSIYDLEHRAEHDISTLIHKGVDAPELIDSCISRTVIPSLHVVVSDAGMGELDSWVMQAADGRGRLRMATAHLADQYDHVIIDTCGAVGPIQEAAIFASDRRQRGQVL
jgi:chromosome partitioning related protein ParA